MRPLRNYMYVAPIVRKLSQIIQVENKEVLNRATVLAVGRDCKRSAVGDVVHFTKFDKPSFRQDGKTVLVIQEADVCAIEIQSVREENNG